MVSLNLLILMPEYSLVLLLWSSFPWCIRNVCRAASKEKWHTYLMKTQNYAWHNVMPFSVLATVNISSWYIRILEISEYSVVDIQWMIVIYSAEIIFFCPFRFLFALLKKSSFWLLLQGRLRGYFYFSSAELWMVH